LYIFSIWYILRSFDKLYVFLVFLVTWYIFARKLWQPFSSTVADWLHSFARASGYNFFGARRQQAKQKADTKMMFAIA
jgi:hypothetical protein